MRFEFFDRIHTVVSAGSMLVDDKTASVAPEVYDPMWYNGDLIKAGTRINWNGTLKRAAVDLWDTEEHNPDNAPMLWEDIAYRAGIRIIPDVITAGTAFAKGEQGWWGNVLYVSLIDNNVWTPDGYPDGWAVIESYTGSG